MKRAVLAAVVVLMLVLGSNAWAAMEPTQLVNFWRCDDKCLEVSVRYFAFNNRPTQFNGDKTNSTEGIIHTLELRGQANLLKNSIFRLDGYMDIMIGTHWDIFDVVSDIEQIQLTNKWAPDKAKWLAERISIDIGRQGNGNVGAPNPPREGFQTGMTYYWLGTKYAIWKQDTDVLEIYGRHYFNTGQAGLITEKFGVPNISSQLMQKELGLKLHTSHFGDAVRLDINPYMHAENSFKPQMYGVYAVADYHIGSVVKALNPETYGFKGKSRIELGVRHSQNASYVLTNGGPNTEDGAWVRFKIQF